MPNYYISFLTQFIAISVVEGKQLLKILLDNNLKKQIKQYLKNQLPKNKKVFELNEAQQKLLKK